MSGWIAFLLGCAGILVMPGPTNTLLVASGLSAGLRRSLVLTPAEVFGYMFAVMIATAVADTLQASWMAVAVRLCISTYLLGLAVHLWWQRRPAIGIDSLIGPNKVFLTTLLNPKGLLFAFVLMPAKDREWWPHLIAL